MAADGALGRLPSANRGVSRSGSDESLLRAAKDSPSRTWAGLDWLAGSVDLWDLLGEADWRSEFADLHGLEDARYALEVAAAGGHHLMLSGPKGSGKTSLAERLPGILPDLTPAEGLELTAIHSLAGALEPEDGLLRRPPYFAPHHGASASSLLGGGSGRLRQPQSGLSRRLHDRGRYPAGIPGPVRGYRAQGVATRSGYGRGFGNRRSSRAISRSSVKDSHTAPRSSAAFGIAETPAQEEACDMVQPPACRSSSSPCAPSRPMPESTTPTVVVGWDTARD